MYGIHNNQTSQGEDGYQRGQRWKVNVTYNTRGCGMWDDGCTTARETRVRNDAVGGLLVAEIT